MFVAYCALALGLPLLLSSPDITPPALKRLYDKPAHQNDAGEPEVTVGIVTDVSEMTLVAHGTLTATWSNGEGTYRRSLPDGALLRVRLLSGRAAPMRYAVPVHAHRWLNEGCAQPEDLAGTLNEVQYQGSFWPMFHPPQDLRRCRQVRWAPSLRGAHKLAKKRGHGTGTSLAPEQALMGYPSARLLVHAEHADTSMPLGEATSLITVQSTSGSDIEVCRVPFAMGYPWAGVANRRYRGDMHIVPDPNGRLAVVNVVPLESMLQGVVPSEVPVQAPPEALAAQAVAARSNIVWSFGLRHVHEPYHFCAEQHCQVYAGLLQEDDRTNAAVQATHGAVAVLQGRVVNALYSASCGGHTENNDIAWQQAPDGALRGVSDQLSSEGAPHFDNTQRLSRHIKGGAQTYCTAATLAHPGHGRWQKVFTEADLQALWAPWHRTLGPLQDVVAGPRGPGGRLTTLTLVGAHGKHTLRHELPIRQALGGLHSAAFVLEIERDSQNTVQRLTLRGVGWGHGVGLCQMGTIGRAQAGASHQEILAHYYGGAHVEHFWSTFAP